MSNALIPFWIYWVVLVVGCILFFMCPLLFFVILPVFLVIIPAWLIVIYLVGGLIQQRSGFKKRRKRMMVSFLCSLLTISIFPVCSFLYDAVQWNTFHFDSFINNFNGRLFWILFAVHFLVFWAGEEMENMYV